MSVLGPGDTFGTLTRIERCGETAVTMIDSCIISIPVRVVRSVLERHPKVAMAAFDELADRLEQSYQALEQLSVGSADKRVAAALLNLSEKLGRSGHLEESSCPIPLSRADLGSHRSDHTGVSEPSIGTTARGRGRRFRAAMDLDHRSGPAARHRHELTVPTYDRTDCGHLNRADRSNLIKPTART